MRGLTRCDIQSLVQADDDVRTGLDFMVLHNVATKIDMPRGLYERQGDRRIRQRNAEAKPSRPNGFSLCLDKSGVCFSRAFDGEHVFRTCASRLVERLVEGSMYVEVGGSVSSFWEKAEVDIISVDTSDRLIGWAQIKANYNPFNVFSGCATKELVYSPNEFGGAHLAGVKVISSVFSEIRVYEGCRGCEGLDDVRVTKVCNNCTAATGKPAKYFSFMLKVDINGRIEKTLWRGKSASLYVMQYLDACEMNDPFAIADAIERAFPRDHLLDLIVWYRTHIASDGVECPVNLLHVVLSRPANHADWPVHQPVSLHDSMGYGDLPEVASLSEAGTGQGGVDVDGVLHPVALNAYNQSCGTNATLQGLFALPPLRASILQTERSNRAVCRALVRCVEALQSGIAPRPEFIRGLRLHTMPLLRAGEEGSNVVHMWNALAMGVPLDSVRFAVHRQYRCPVAGCEMVIEEMMPEVHHMLTLPHNMAIQGAWMPLPKKCNKSMRVILFIVPTISHNKQWHTPAASPDTEMGLLLRVRQVARLPFPRRSPLRIAAGQPVVWLSTAPITT